MLKKSFVSKIFNPQRIVSTFKLTPQEVYDEIYKGGYPEFINDEDIDRNQFYNQVK